MPRPAGGRLLQSLWALAAHATAALRAEAGQSTFVPRDPDTAALFRMNSARRLSAIPVVRRMRVL